ncbi:MAG: sigma-54-dependent Fis family transcriptional regulator [Nitrospirae bacterium]|nr:sigma-54-dependent Fis family transcriptional regulator [Nitrospirota bacterium]
MENGNDISRLDLDPDSIMKEEPSVDCVGGLLLGNSRRITDIKNIIRRVAQPDITVLLRGESGTGKELAAQAIYRHSNRMDKPFVKVLCAAIPEGLLESELFGHEKGAFTGAHRMKPGKFEFANKGTIFLDEIGDVPQSLQSKLLQVLQDGEFSRIGGREVEVDVRVIAATNKNLERAVVAGTFREDLFYRLNVVSITMPSLRDRKEDIPVLTEFFLHKYCNIYNKDYRTLSQETMDRFASYRWPGNVRELENIVKRIIVLGSEKVELSGCSEADASVDNAPMVHLENKEKDTVEATFKPRRLKEIAQEAVSRAEEEAIRKTLLLCRWNRRKTAEMLSISYKTLFYKMRQYNLFE